MGTFLSGRPFRTVCQYAEPEAWGVCEADRKSNENKQKGRLIISRSGPVWYQYALHH